MLFYLDNWMSAGDSPNANADDPGRRALRARHPRWFRDLPRHARKPVRRNAGDQRKLRPRAPRAPYARRRRRIHPGRRPPGRFGLHGLDDRRTAQKSARRLQRPDARREPEDRFGTDHSPVGGAHEGDFLLDLLARHPKTAEHVSRKLALRFVSDDPPPALVARLADTFRRTDGDVRAILAALFRSPEFWSGRSPPGEDQDAAPTRRIVASRDGRGEPTRASRSCGPQGDGPAPLPLPAADRIQGDGGDVVRDKRDRSTRQSRRGPRRQSVPRNEDGRSLPGGRAEGCPHRASHRGNRPRPPGDSCLEGKRPEDGARRRQAGDLPGDVSALTALLLGSPSSRGGRP